MRSNIRVRALNAQSNRGVASIEWEIVECPVSGNVTLLNKDGINPWWYAVFALEIRQGVTGLEVRDSSPGATSLEAVRQSYNAFVVQTGSPLVLPYSVRLTSITGEVISRANVVTTLDDLAEFDPGLQFDTCAIFANGFEAGSTAAWSATVLQTKPGSR